MQFGSFEYLLFLVFVTIIYFQIPKKISWIWLLLVSYFFYSLFGFSYLVILITVTVTSYLGGREIAKCQNKRTRKKLLWLFITLTLLPLLGLKYYNFFNQIVSDGLSIFEMKNPLKFHGLLLPLGISFFTFQSLSYLLDIYKGYLKPKKHFGKYAVFVSFFPQLLARPIERAKKLLPQIEERDPFSYQNAVWGLRLILWGMFKKMVVSSRLQNYVDIVFEQPESHSGFTIWLACAFFTLQVFTDFSAYSDIAIGSARMLGFKLSKNFDDRVYAANSRTNYWRGWHISLTTWFRDYVFFPMSAKVKHKWRMFANLLFIYLLIGLWHGASWGFVIWGLLNGVLVVAEQSTKTLRFRFFDWLGITNYPKIFNTLATITSFGIGTLIGLWFRAKDLATAWSMFGNIFDETRNLIAIGSFPFLFLISILLFMDLVHVWAKGKPIPEAIGKLNPIFRWAFYFVIAELIFNFGFLKSEGFFYFQF